MRRFFLASATALLLAGCGAPYHYVARAAPNPFTRPGCKLVMERVHAERLVVGHEPVLAYLREKGPETADSFDADVRDSNAEFAQRVVDTHPEIFGPGAPDNTFLLRPWFVHWEPGFWPGGRGVADVEVDVLGPGSRLLDKITIETKAGDFSSGGRMKKALRSAGSAVGAYVSDRWSCAER
jgi:hypothetical protein